MHVLQCSTHNFMSYGIRVFGRRKVPGGGATIRVVMSSRRHFRGLTCAIVLWHLPISMKDYIFSISVPRVYGIPQSKAEKKRRLMHTSDLTENIGFHHSTGIAAIPWHLRIFSSFKIFTISHERGWKFMGFRDLPSVGRIAKDKDQEYCHGDKRGRKDILIPAFFSRMDNFCGEVASSV